MIGGLLGDGLNDTTPKFDRQIELGWHPGIVSAAYQAGDRSKWGFSMTRKGDIE